MATLTIPNIFANATTAVASEVNANFTAVKAFVELLAAGTNLDALAVTYSHLAAATITSLTTTIVTAAVDDAGVVLAGQVFG